MPQVNPLAPPAAMAEDLGRIRERPADPAPAGGDPLGALLAGTRAQGAFLLRSVFDPPWAIHVRDQAPLTVLTMFRGDGWIVHDRRPPVRLRTGDLAVVRGPEPYTVADHPSTEPRAIIHPGQVATDPAGARLCAELDRGVRTWGTRPDAAHVLVSGTYQLPGEVGRRLLHTLPNVLHLAAGAWHSPLLPLLEEEMGRDEPGQAAVLDRLLDLVLIGALRAWLTREGAAAPAWYRAHGDPVAGPALGLLHADPARPWTVAALAAEVGVSRTVLARRFTELVGDPPMSYLTGWRLSLAADLLASSDATLASVARQVGYGSAFALSAAFKRVRGLSPARHRDAFRAPGPASGPR
ncbi:Transcriptional regulator, AraC family protein [Streptomyces mobaraensis NBRC 13819 = DSM 40847]|uniref:Transcriptional regulator, AraC family protein n=2 Tax=Streptomyces mobaraensis TaxID=35621 RepID=M3B6B3_STRM1|nr:AraC family transcriptional regulator [Streptomyces mobaraensis]EMF01528.1 Transcriptional regulator, AraC family protein [Streptomyces mobaraensis NBRC 13819 = DSM 40847]